MFPVLVSGSCFGSCFYVCFYSTVHAPWDGSGHTFFSPFSLWYAFFLLFMLFWTPRGILFPFLSFSGMSSLQFLKHMLKWLMPDIWSDCHLTGLSIKQIALDLIVYWPYCLLIGLSTTGLSLTRLSFIRQFSNSLEWHIMMLGQKVVWPQWYQRIATHFVLSHKKYNPLPLVSYYLFWIVFSMLFIKSKLSKNLLP